MSTLTAKEFVARLAPVEFERLVLIFNYLADHAHELRLISGDRLNDILDFAAFLRELAAALRFPESTEVPDRPDSRPSPKVTLRESQPRWSRRCPDCDHEHEGRNECSYYLGEGKFCQCETKVTA